MKTALSPSWELSTDHAASHGGQLVLADWTTGEAFGPADLVRSPKGSQRGTVPGSPARGASAHPCPPSWEASASLGRQAARGRTPPGRARPPR